MARPAPQPATAGKLCRSSELRGSSRQGKANSKQSPQSQEWASWSAGHGTADGRKRLRRMPFVGVLIPPSQGFRRGLSVKLFSFSSLLSPALTALAPSLRPATDALSGAAGCDCGGGQLVRLACRRDFSGGVFDPPGGDGTAPSVTTEGLSDGEGTLLGGGSWRRDEESSGGEAP